MTGKRNFSSLVLKLASGLLAFMLLCNAGLVAGPTASAAEEPVEHGETAELGQVTPDDRGEAMASTLHQATIAGLRPETTCIFRVHSGQTVDDDGGALYRVTTKETTLPPLPHLAYGQVETSDGAPAGTALVRAWVEDAQGNGSGPVSAAVDGWHTGP